MKRNNRIRISRKAPALVEMLNYLVEVKPGDIRIPKTLVVQQVAKDMLVLLEEMEEIHNRLDEIGRGGWI